MIIMRKALFSLATILLASCGGSAQPGPLIALGDATAILGEACHLADSSTTRAGAVQRRQLTYTADADEAGTGRRGNLYVMIEDYDAVTAAREKYASIKTANEDHEGIEVLDDLGDEAYFHSDGENFLFIMVRKGTMVFNMKVNKLTRSTSREAFIGLARRIAG